MQKRKCLYYIFNVAYICVDIDNDEIQDDLSSKPQFLYDRKKKISRQSSCGENSQHILTFIRSKQESYSQKNIFIPLEMYRKGEIVWYVEYLSGI